MELRVLDVADETGRGTVFPLSAAMMRQSVAIGGAEAVSDWTTQVCDTINLHGIFRNWISVDGNTLVLVEDVDGISSGFSLAGVAKQLLRDKPAIKIRNGTVEIRFPKLYKEHHTSGECVLPEHSHSELPGEIPALREKFWRDVHGRNCAVPHHSVP